jgi:hypothetical protein
MTMKSGSGEGTQIGGSVVLELGVPETAVSVWRRQVRLFVETLRV